jgi:hypothetical protein
MIESFFQIFSMASLLFDTFQTNKKNEGETPGKCTREEKRKDQSPNKRQHPKAKNTQWEDPRGKTK